MILTIGFCKIETSNIVDVVRGKERNSASDVGKTKFQSISNNQAKFFKNTLRIQSAIVLVQTLWILVSCFNIFKQKSDLTFFFSPYDRCVIWMDTIFSKKVDLIFVF